MSQPPRQAADAADAVPAAHLAARLPATRWALLYGNFVIGCGVMVVAGSLNDLARSLQVSVTLAGQLITIAAAVMCFGAPVLAGWVSGFDRRRLLAWSLVWYGLGHAASALMPSYAALWPMRALTVLAAAVFTPQAAAAVGWMAEPAQRGRVITFVFVGWSVASVLGMPVGAWLSETQGWRTAFAVIAGLSLLGAAAVAVTMPDGVKPPALSLAAWQSLFRDPVLMAMVAVTALHGAGQFTLLSYLAPYARLELGATAGELSLLFFWFGACGLVGNLVLSRQVDRVGAGRASTGVMWLTAFTLLVWPFAHSLPLALLAITPWALACFASNSAQQARLGQAAPAFAAALMALNSSAIYLGQAAGASSGGWLVAHVGYGSLSTCGLLFVLVAIAASAWVSHRMARRAA
jgi:predicted MFS family arabinose efflux permease